MKKVSLLIVVAMLATLALAACSGGGGGGATLDVTLNEFSFTPNAWTVNAGQQVTINLKNAGTVTHDFTIMKTPISGSFTDADKANEFWASQMVAAGQSVTQTFTAPSTPGTYQVICTESGHFEAGMVGTLTVK
jgi:plastocyanin